MSYKPPNDINELEKMYYGNNKDGRDVNAEDINRYEKDFNNPEKYPDRLNISESAIKDFLSQIGEVKKIPEEENKTPDFEIIGKNLFVEVKSINTVIGKSISETEHEVNIKNESEWLEKINLTLKDIEKKRDIIPSNSLYIGAIYVDVVQMLGFGKNILNLDFIKRTVLGQTNIDGLLLYIEQSGGNIKNKRPILFSKNPNLTGLFEKHYPDSRLKIEKYPEARKTLDENMSFMLNILEDVRKKTEENQKEKVYVWTEHYSNWIDIWKDFNECIGKENFLNSCIGFRLTQLNKELLWFWLECTSGAYDNANRSMRYVLESFLQAYYVDIEHPHTSMACKLEILKEIDTVEFAGSRLIEKLDIDGYKEKIKKLYRDLNKFVHPSHKEWQKIIEGGDVFSKITFNYDKESFEECVEFTDRVIDIIVFLLMNFSDGISKKMK